MRHCATAQCPRTATLLLTAHGAGPITYRATQTCTTCAPKHRAWVSRAGPTLQQTPLTPTTHQQPAQAQAQLF